MFLGHFFFPAFHEDKSIGSTQRKGKKNAHLSVKSAIRAKSQHSSVPVLIGQHLVCKENGHPSSASVLCVCVWGCVCVCVQRWQMRGLHQYLNKALWHLFLLRPCCFFFKSLRGRAEMYCLCDSPLQRNYKLESSFSAPGRFLQSDWSHCETCLGTRRRRTREENWDGDFFK